MLILVGRICRAISAPRRSSRVSLFLVLTILGATGCVPTTPIPQPTAILIRTDGIAMVFVACPNEVPRSAEYLIHRIPTFEVVWSATGYIDAPGASVRLDAGSWASSTGPFPVESAGSIRVVSSFAWSYESWWNPETATALGAHPGDLIVMESPTSGHLTSVDAFLSGVHPRCPTNTATYT